MTVTDPSATTSADQPIFHLALPDAWAAAFASGEYRWSTRGVTLEQEGFIHCSTRDQMEDTANRFYGDLDQLVVLTIDPLLVPSPIVFEPPAPDVAVLFPHIYGPMEVKSVAAVADFAPNPDGTFNLPRSLA